LGDSPQHQSFGEVFLPSLSLQRTRPRRAFASLDPGSHAARDGWSDLSRAAYLDRWAASEMQTKASQLFGQFVVKQTSRSAT